jgi:two-component system, sensor histidine kinase
MQPGGEGIAAVAVTGYGQPRDRRQALAAGFDDHLVKPIDADELSAIVLRLQKRAPAG